MLENWARRRPAVSRNPVHYIAAVVTKRNDVGAVPLASQ